MKQRKLRVETLEDRRMMAVVTVDTELDIVDASDERTSLREAVIATNGMAGPDEITFSADLTGKTILLTQGELLVEDDLTVTGLGADQLTIDASGSDPTPDENNGDGSRIFHMPRNQDGSENSLAISGLTLTGGDSTRNAQLVPIGQAPRIESGGAIRVDGSLAVHDSVVVGNHGHRLGGGIYARTINGSVDLHNVLISGNSISPAAGFPFIAPNRAEGGGIALEVENGTVTIADVEVSKNIADLGGGMSLDATGEYASITLSSSQVMANSAGGDFLISVNGSNVPDYGGGGILVNLEDQAALQMDSIEIRGNSILGEIGTSFFFPPTYFGGGLNILAAGRSVADIRNSHFEENTVNGRGGGFAAALDTGSQLQVQSTEVFGNEAVRFDDSRTFNGGGFFISARNGSRFNGSGMHIERNMAATSGGGAAFSVLNSAAEVANSRIVYNSSGDGGGLAFSGTASEDDRVLISRSRIEANTAERDGGGVGHLAPLPNTILGIGPRAIGLRLEIEESLVLNNSSGRFGGGIYASHSASVESDSLMRISNSTVSMNESVSEGGGIYNNHGRTFLENSTVTLNRSKTTAGAGVSSAFKTSSHFFSPSNHAETILANTIVAANHGIDIHRDDAPFGLPGFTSFGYNLIGTTNANWTYDPRDTFGVTNPLIGPLADNGGPTLTHALLDGSPALDAGDPNAGAGVDGVPLFDQRQGLFSRIVGGRIDIGAFERQTQHADYDQDLDVDGTDFLLLQRGYGTAGADKLDGDADGDADVDHEDMLAWQNAHGATSLSSQLHPADFDRNLYLDGGDFLTWQRNLGQQDATRADGDADGDTDVDRDDLFAWLGGLNPNLVLEVPLAVAGLMDHAAPPSSSDAEIMMRQSFSPIARTQLPSQFQQLNDDRWIAADRSSVENQADGESLDLAFAEQFFANLSLDRF